MSRAQLFPIFLYTAKTRLPYDMYNVLQDPYKGADVE